MSESLARLRRDVRLARRMLSALLARDDTAIRALLGSPESLLLPREVREEAYLFLTLPATSMRAPMRAILHARRAEELLTASAADGRHRRAG